MTPLKPIADWMITRPTLFSSPTNADSSLLPIVTHHPFLASTPPLNHDYQGNSRLGFVYQYVCQQLFHSHPDYQIEAEEIQLQHDGRTLGAIDFIVRHLPTDQQQHWEVAIKFYLLKDGRWYGPNAHDRLDKKLDRMLTHQLQMSQSDAFTARYPEWHDPTPHLLMQGRLYINPFDEQPVPSHCLGYPLNPDRIAGFWCYHHQWKRHLQEKEGNLPLYVLNKPQWIIGRDANSPRLTQLEDRFVHCQDASGRFWFIMPEHWPNT